VAADSIPVPDVDEVPVAVVRKDDFALVLGCNDRATELLGWTSDELAGRRALDFVHPDDRRRCIAAWVEMLGLTAGSNSCEWRHLHKNGAYVWIECTNRNLLTSHGYVESEIRETARRTGDEPAPDLTATPSPAGASFIARVMEEQEWLLQRIAQSLPIGVALIDRCGAIEFANEKMRSLVGASTAATTTDLIMSATPEFRTLLMMELERAFSEGSDADLEVEVVNFQSKLVSTCSVNLRPLNNQPGEVPRVLMCIQDITESSRLRQQLVTRATTDTLTGCWNRASTFELLSDLLERDHPVAVLFVDVNGLKVVNDRSGHAAGDSLLAEIAGHLRSAARTNDVVGRIGGDEFLIVCPGIADAETAFRLSCRYSEVVDDRWPSGLRAAPMLSVGVAYTASAHTSPDQLVAAADAAMYRAKEARAGLPVLAPMEVG
jgi:diguanylate cyclase (GGDEF)-like protein/PAS domain S-box-containing protein